MSQNRTMTPSLPPVSITPTTNPLLSGPIAATLWRLSLPNMVAMLATALVSVAETGYVGQLGTAALAGIALVFPMIMLQQMLSAGSIGGGISAAISRALGAGHPARAESLALHAVVIGVVTGLFFTALFLVAGEDIYQLMGGQGEALAQALAYSNVAFLGAVLIWLTNALASVIRGSGNMKVPSYVLFGVALLQVVLGGVLGLGLGPAPRMGMAGVAWGQVIAYAAGTVFFLFYVRSGRSRVRLVFSHPLHQTDFMDILRVGGMSSLSSLQTVLTILILTRIVSRFGTEALAGYGVGVRLEFLLIPITFAIGVACVPMVGMAIGAGQVQRARQVAWTGAIFSAAIVGCVGLFAALMPNLWTELFTRDASVIHYAGLYFAWVGPVYAFFAFGLCLYFSSQGAGKLLGPVLAGTLRLVLVAVGGWYLVDAGAPVWQMFALIGMAMVAYGIMTGFAVYRVRWG